MQIKKENIRQNILKIARREFIKKGFKKTSMRVIASKSEVGLSNIYNYFSSKDEIFVTTIKPLLSALEKLTETHNTPNRLTTDWFTIETYQQIMLNDFLEIINNYRSELKLLFFGASGSSLENYTDILVDQNTQMAFEYFKLMKLKYPSINDNISHFFVHTASSWWITIMSEIVSHDELTEKDIKHFVEDYIAFGTAGWKSLMNI